MKAANQGRKTRPNPKPVYHTKTTPAPVKGLNYRDPIALMSADEALRLDNIICRPGFLEVRKGKVRTAIGFIAPVETLFAYSGVSGSLKLFAAAGTGIFDATSSGTVGAAVVVGLTSAYWAQTQVSNSGGNYLLIVNGQDSGRIYDGSSWAALGFTGLATASMSQINVWKRRVWVVEKNSFNAWYSAVDAITGALTSFTFAGIFKRGGRLQAILNWTIDGGVGADDFLLAVSSLGEVAVYKGIDPTSAATFALVGVYFIGPPIGERFYASYGGDILMLTGDGLIPFSVYLQSATINRSVILTDRIQPLLSGDLSAYGSVRGWEVHVFYDSGFILLHVPAGAAGFRYQYIMSTIHKAWSRFLHKNANTWMVLKNQLFVGEQAEVANAWQTGTDYGVQIEYTIIPAFSYFSSPTTPKIFGLGRCLMESDQSPTFLVKVLTDFNLAYTFPPLIASNVSGNVWDVAIWDASQWSAALFYSKSWYSIAGLGYAGTQVIYGVSTANLTKILTLDCTYELGELL